MFRFALALDRAWCLVFEEQLISWVEFYNHLDSAVICSAIQYIEQGSSASVRRLFVQ